MKRILIFFCTFNYQTNNAGKKIRLSKLFLIFMCMSLLCGCQNNGGAINDAAPTQPSKTDIVNTAGVTAQPAPPPTILPDTSLPQISDPTPETTPIQHNIDWMANYPSILQEYRLFVDNMANGKYDTINEDGIIFDDDVFKSPAQGDLSGHWFCMKVDANLWYDPSMARNVFGYALEDFNEDGVDELILLEKDYTVLAIFSTVNGKPKLLDAYWSRYECAILDSGFLHKRGDDGAADWEHAIQRLSSDGSELLNVVQYGCRSDKQHPGEHHYYRIESGKEEEISEAELDTLIEQYPFYEGEYPNFSITPRKTTENSGITFIPIFD